MTDSLKAFLTLFIPVCLITVAQTPLRRGRGLDLSGPGVICASTAAGIWIYGVSAASVPAATLMILATGLVIGVLQGIAVARYRLPPWLVTLLGLAAGTSLDAGPWHPPEFSIPSDFAAISQPIAAWVILSALIGVTLWLLQQKFVFGRWLQAVGFNEETARLAGVPVTALKVATYGLSGLGAAAAAGFLAGHPAPALWPTPSALLLDVLGASVMAAAFPWEHHTQIISTVVAAAAMVILGLALHSLGLPIALIIMLKAALTLGIAATFPCSRAGLTPLATYTD